MQGDGRVPWIITQVFIHTVKDGLEGGVGEAVSGGGENTGDGRIDGRVVAGIRTELIFYSISSHDVWQIIPIHYNLKDMA